MDTPNFLNEAWVGAKFTDPDGRSAAQAAELAVSDALVAELEAEDVIVMGAPIYNFSIPAVLKAWIDLIARAKVTFRYGENGPEGLLKNKKVYVMMASDGVPTARWISPRLISGTFLVLLALRMWSSFLPPKSKRIRVGWLQRSPARNCTFNRQREANHGTSSRRSMARTHRTTTSTTFRVYAALAAAPQ